MSQISWLYHGFFIIVILMVSVLGCDRSDSDQVFMGQLVKGEVTPLTVDGYDLPPKFVSEGNTLYIKHGCPVCHGMAGYGDGPIAATLNSPPTDFRDPRGYSLGRDLVTISKTLQEGIPGNPSMPPFTHLKDEERFKIAMYVSSLQD